MLPMTQQLEQARDHEGFAPSVIPIATTTLDAPISCLAFAPQHSTFLVIGTYKLQEDDGTAGSGAPQDRTGSIQVVEVRDQSL